MGLLDLLFKTIPDSAEIMVPNSIANEEVNMDEAIKEVLRGLFEKDCSDKDDLVNSALLRIKGIVYCTYLRERLKLSIEKEKQFFEFVRTYKEELEITINALQEQRKERVSFLSESLRNISCGMSNDGCSDMTTQSLMDLFISHNSSNEESEEIIKEKLWNKSMRGTN